MTFLQLKVDVEGGVAQHLGGRVVGSRSAWSVELVPGQSKKKKRKEKKTCLEKTKKTETTEKLVLW